MKKVNQLANSNNPDYLIKDGKEYTLALKYQQNIVGASTDIALRQARYDSLTEALIGKK